MSEPSLALQAAFYAVLTPALAPVLVYDRVPPNAICPYVDIGEDQIVPAPVELASGLVEVRATLHVWSRAVGRGEVKGLCGTVVAALDEATLDLGTAYEAIECRHTGTRQLTDPDGLTSHAVVTFTVLIDPVS